MGTWVGWRWHKEQAMARKHISHHQAGATTKLPRGWIILGLAATSWALVIALINVVTTSFSFIQSTLF